MTEIDIARYEALIDEAVSNEHFMQKLEKTFFDVGLRGHYENPTTELLAFFLNSNGEHGLGGYFLLGLFNALAVDYQEAGSFIKVDTEVHTDGGRIDLLIEMENMVLIIECKTHHHVNNPFASYEEYAQEIFENKPNKEFVLLSITGEGLNKSSDSPYCWKGLSYENLAKSIDKYKTNNSTCNKWQVLANELLLQFENYGIEKMNEEQFEFTLENLANINQLKRLENAFYDEVANRVKSKVDENKLLLIESKNIKVRHETWPETSKVLRFSLENWQDEHDCALCFYQDKDKSFMVRTWVVESDKQRFNKIINTIPSELKLDMKSGEFESYKKNKWFRWDWHFKGIDSAIELVTYLLQALDEIEKISK